MANQPETSAWTTGVYQWETTDPAQGGLGGVMNTPILQLSSRTRWLKDQVEALSASIAGGAPLNSPALIGNPTAPTAAQFDNDTSIATTAFVQRALGNLGGVDSYNTSFTLTAAQSGRGILYYGGSDAAAVLPLLSAVPFGAAFWIHNIGGSTLTVQRQGSDTLYGVSGATTVALGPGDSLFVVREAGWMIAGGSAQSRYSYSATLKANTSGSYPGMSVGYATSAGNADTVDGWHANDLRNWSNLLNIPAIVYNNGGTYGINITGSSNYAANADTVDGYHASQLWRADMASSWPGGFKLPNGWIIQMGKSPAQALGARPVTFPVSFPNAVLGVSATKSHPSNSSVVPGTAWSVNTTSLSGMTLGVNDNGYDVFWLAIGN